jgi:[ribosomal protein S5]-alanine N-acetyltransferase
MGRQSPSPRKIRPLHTPRLVLRLPGPADALELEQMFHDPRVYRYLPFDRRMQSGRELVSQSRQALRAGTAYRFIVRTKLTNRFVGSVILFQVDHRNRSAEIGYALAKNQWGQGYATESTSRLIRWAFSTLHFRRIIATVSSRNTASQRVLRKMRFRIEGRRRKASREGRIWLDDLEYGLLRAEFRGH